MHNNVVSPKIINVIFNMIDFVIQKRITIQLIDLREYHLTSRDLGLRPRK